MAATTPFQPLSGTTTGRSVMVFATISSSSAGVVTIASSTAYAPSLLITNTGSTTLFVRMSSEAVPVATSSDVPISPNSQRIFSNPVPMGTLGIAVTASVLGSGGGAVIITPGQGGI